MKLKIITFSILIGSIIAMGCASVFKTNSALAQEFGYKIFVNPQYKFSIEYPDDLGAHDYLYDSKGPMVSFDSIIGTDSSDFIKTHSEFSMLNLHPNNMTLQQFIDHQISSDVISTNILEKPTPIKVAGSSGLVFSTVDMIGMSKKVVFSHGDNIFEFIYMVDKTNFNESQFKHMVDSIKFLH
jgi:hypothetical protein